MRSPFFFPFFSFFFVLLSVRVSRSFHRSEAMTNNDMRIVKLGRPVLATALAYGGELLKAGSRV